MSIDHHRRPYLQSLLHRLIEYVDLTPEEFQQKMTEYEQQLKAYFDEGHKLEEEILKGLGDLVYD
jgi:type I restriction enzyme M protein